MIHAICDFCGQDCDSTANLLSITPFQNFARYHTDSEPYGSRGKTKSFVICSSCMEKYNMPNPYHDYQSITKQEMAYGKCLDNYTEEDFKIDVRERKQGRCVKC